MSIQTENFCPASAYVIAATTTSSNTALTQPPNVTGPVANTAGNSGGYSTIVVYNAAAKVAYLSFGNASQTATASSLYQVPPGVQNTFDLTIPATNVGVILESGASAANVYLMLGTGS